MADLARLGIEIDSRSVKEGVGELDKLTAAGTKAEKAIDRLGDEAKQSGGQIKTASQQAADYAANAQRMATNSTLTGSSVSGLGRATSLAARSVNTLSTEVGVLASGLATGSIGAQGLASSLGRISVAALVLVPALGGLAVAGAAVALALKGIKDDAASDAEMKRFAGTLSLTKKEMEKLKDVTVTWGDVGKATFQVLAEAAGTSASEITGWFDYAFKKIGEFGKFSVAIIYAAFVAGAKGIINTWNAVPAIIGEAAVNAANFALVALEAMVNMAVQKINSLIAGVNVLPFVDLPSIAAASFGQIENKWAGTTKNLADTLDADLHSAFDSAMGTMDAISARASDIAKNRVGAQAADIIDDRSDKKGKATKQAKERAKALSEEEKAYRAAMKAAQAYLAALSEETDKIGKSAVEIKRMDVAMAAAAARRAAAVAPTKEGTVALLAQADAIVKAGQAWEMVYKNDQIQQFIKDTVEALEFENRLIVESAAQQQIMRAERELTAAGIEKGSVAWERYIAAVEAATAAEERFKGAEQLLETLTLIADQAAVTGQIMADAFGKPGAVIGDLIANLAEYQEAKQDLTVEVLKGNKTQQQADKALATLQARNTASAIAGVKSLFKEKSTGYKVMQAIEMAYAAFQLANSIASIARGKAEVANEVADAAVKTTANTAAGASKIFSQLGVWAFPVVGAMIALLATLGAKGGGGSSGPKIPSAEDIQEAQGTGTVLGDAKAKSNSIANSLEIVAANTNKDLEYSNAMLRALQNIDVSIAKMAGTVARQIQLSGSLFDTSKLNLGSSGSGGFLGIGASSTTRSLWDLGIKLATASVADIIANGISGSSYQVVQKVKEKSGFLGIGGGTKTSYSTKKGALDPEIVNAITDVVTALRDGLVAAADVIGLEGAEAILNSFNVSIGKISFKDMTGEQIEDTLNAIFSKVGDQMAGAILPSLSTMQKVGEGLFETFMRVAREYEVVDIALKSIGKVFGAVGVASIQARDNLVQLFGGLEEFVDATNLFRDEFLSEAEQIAPVAASVRAELARLGMAGITTREQFKNAVLGLDLTTQAGRDMYAALLKVAPAFDKVLDYYEEAQKKTADALQDTADKFNGFAASLRKYRDTLFATDASQGNAYAALRAKFIATSTLAATGDAGALGGLEGAGKDFLTVAKNNASSLLQYQRDVALVAQGVDKGIFAAESVADYAELQLAAMQNSVSILSTIATNTAATAVALGVQTLPTPVPGSPVAAQSLAAAPAEPSAAIVQATTDNKVALEAIASLLAEMNRRWGRMEENGAMAVATREGDQVDVNLESWG